MANYVPNQDKEDCMEEDEEWEDLEMVAGLLGGSLLQDFEKEHLEGKVDFVPHF